MDESESNNVDIKEKSLFISRSAKVNGNVNIAPGGGANIGGSITGNVNIHGGNFNNYDGLRLKIEGTLIADKYADFIVGDAGANYYHGNSAFISIAYDTHISNGAQIGEQYPLIMGSNTTSATLTVDNGITLGDGVKIFNHKYNVIKINGALNLKGGLTILPIIIKT